MRQDDPLDNLAGLIEPSYGEIIFSEQPLNGQLQSAMVFQDQGLFPWMCVQDNVAFGLETQGAQRSQRRQMARDFLRKLAWQLRQQLSARAFRWHAVAGSDFASLSGRSADLVMDEPFGALDSQTLLVMQEELLRIWSDHRKTVVYVTHDIEEAILWRPRAGDVRPTGSDPPGYPDPS